MRSTGCVLALLAALVAVCGCSVSPSDIKDGDTVRYEVNGIAGTGVVVGVQERLEGREKVLYYKVDAGVDGSGNRDQALLHERLLKPLK